MQYIRYSVGDQIHYGTLEGETVHRLDGDLFEGRPTSITHARSEITLLAPCQPSKVIAIGLNYKSHLGKRPCPEVPGIFAKFPTCIIGPGQGIEMPPDAMDLHYEGEMVVVIGKRCKRVSVEEAPEHVFGVTAGNDVSERRWQSGDLQWFRAKGSDTFGPLGPAITTGLDYGNLLLETRVNGVTRQSQRTSDLLFPVPVLVSYVSAYMTLLPGDVIYTGTPGTTQAFQPGDVIEVELEGVGVLRNRAVAAAVSG